MIWERNGVGNIIDWNFYALSKHIGVLGIAHVKQITQELICATTTLLSKCDNNYSGIVSIALGTRLGCKNAWITQLAHLQVE
jgi:hypothetical protein